MAQSAGCDQKCVLLLYLSIGTEGRRLLTQKCAHDNIYAQAQSHYPQALGNDGDSLHSS